MNPDAALKALAEPHRRAILQLVSHDARPVGDIASHLDITPQAVSRHLKVLHEAGLVDEHHEGTRHLFVVNPRRFQRGAGVPGRLLDPPSRPAQRRAGRPWRPAAGLRAAA